MHNFIVLNSNCVAWLAEHRSNRSVRRKVIGRSLQEVIKDLPAKRREKVSERSQQLIAEVMTLRELRQTMNLTQEELAISLNTQQGSVSKAEKRPDMLVSTLRAHVEAMGGELDLVAKLPGQAPVKIKGLSDLSSNSK